VQTERRRNRLLRNLFEYLNFERPEAPELKPVTTGYVKFKVGWALAGLAVCALTLTAGPYPGLAAPAQRMLAVALLMAVWWLTEAVPISVTALLPLVAFPLLGLADAKATAAPYADPNVFLFIGGFILASCMQKWDLHKRLALHILLAVGSSPHRILMGCMAVTAFLSMWASNTATVLMMFPIASALIDRGDSPDERSRRNFTISLLLGLAYAGSMGGTATLIGTPPNIVFASMVRRLDVGIGEVSFVRWMGLGVPIMLAGLVLIYLLLSRVVYPFDARAFTTDVEHLRREKEALGPMGLGEKYIAVAFSLTALLWITRKDLALGAFVIPGWSGLLPFGHLIHDGTVAIAVSAVLFLLPVDRARGVFLMDRDWYKPIPWDIVLLFGGGFALAQGFISSGLSSYLGARLEFVGGLPTLLVMLLICLFMTFLTEFTSNTATTTVMLPILAATAAATGAQPPLFMLPATFAASAAFMLPVATPPNAIVFASGRIRIGHMARAGLLLNLLTAPVIAVLCWWLGPLVLGF